MNTDQVAGEGKDVLGKVKETAGNVTGDSSLRGSGLADQLGGKVQKTVGTAKEALAQNAGPAVENAKKFARERPYATAALAGVLGIALLNTLRGKKSA